ncbi:hypothetical protein MTP99_003860 [Tenebrio molitor]|jgi:hypothetical protein|nr:hypothetical protein MTP99_003860 [Tenebrio molitor]
MRPKLHENISSWICTLTPRLKLVTSPERLRASSAPEHSARLVKDESVTAVERIKPGALSKVIAVARIKRSHRKRNGPHLIPEATSPDG